MAKVVIISGGYEGYLCLKSLHALHSILAVGPVPKNGDLNSDFLQFSIKNKIPLIKDINEIPFLNPDIILVVSFTQLIPSELVENNFFINIHYALLPKYRGRHGFRWSLINGEKRVGFTIHRIDKNLDTGPIYHQEKFEILKNETSGSLVRRMNTRLGEKLPDIIEGIINGDIQPLKQNEKDATYVSRRYPKDNLIDWNWPSELIVNHVFALAPPYSEGAFTYYNGKKLLITDAEVYKLPNYFEIPGHVVARFSGKGVLVKSSDGSVLVKKISLDGENKPADEFFKTVGARLGFSIHVLNDYIHSLKESE